MSIRDSAGPAGPGNTGAGGIANGGVGGGWGGGGGGGVGAGRNGGAGNQTGMTTGATWHGNTAYGQAGGNVQAYGMRDARSLSQAGMGPTRGTYGNFKTPSGQPMFGGSPVQGQSFQGMNMGQALSQAQRAQAAYRQSLAGPRPGSTARPASAPPGLLDPPAASYPAYEAEMALPEYPPVQEIDIPFPPEAPPPNNTMVIGGNYPDPTIGAQPTKTTYPSMTNRGGWPGQNSYYGRGQVGKAFTDRVPQDSGRMTQSGSTTQTRTR